MRAAAEVSGGLTGEEVAARVRDGLTNAYEETTSRSALDILRANRFKLHEIAHYLQKKETITGDEFMNILTRDDGFAPQMPKQQ